jgi:hypothetical protein
VLSVLEHARKRKYGDFTRSRLEFYSATCSSRNDPLSFVIDCRSFMLGSLGKMVLLQLSLYMIDVERSGEQC